MSEDKAGSSGAQDVDQKQLLKLAIDLGPLLVFLLAWLALGLKWATGVIMIASLIAMLASHRLLGRVSPALIITTVIIVGFGALTLLLDDTDFIKMKPTMVYLLFAAALAAGHVLKRPTLQMLLGEAMRLDDDGWRKLSMRWCLFFLTMAVVNEIVRRNFSESFWVWFKVGGFPLLTFAFLMTQIGFIQRHQVAADTAPNKSDQR